MIKAGLTALRRILHSLVVLLAEVTVGVLLLLTLLVAIVGWLLARDDGSQWLFGQLRTHLPGFALERVEGNLARGLELHGLRYHSAVLDLELQQFGLRFDWSCLARTTVCIDELSAAGGTISLTPGGEPPPPDEPSGPVSIALPIGVELRQLQLSELRYRMPGVEVGLQSLTSAARLQGDTLILEPTELNGLRVSLSDSGAGEAPAGGPQQQRPPVPANKPAGGLDEHVAAIPSQTTKGQSAPISLPEIRLPLAIVVEQLILNDTRLDLSGNPQQLDSLLLKASWRESLLTIERLALSHPMADASLNGRVELRGDYPLKLALQGRIKQLEPLEGQHLALALNGDLQHLRLTLDADQRMQAHLKGELRPLAADLPFDLDLRWSELGWPLTAQPDYLARDGRVRASGSLAGYRFSLKTALTGTGVPDTSVDLIGRGDLNRLDKLALLLDTLGGQVSLNGRLGWQQGVDWQAQLQLQDIDPGVQWPQAKGRLSGRLETHGKLQQGWQAWVDTLDITGELAGYPLQLQGTLASSQTNLVSTDSLLLRSGDNRIHLQGGLGEQWDLLARVDLDNLTQTLAAAAGRVNGEIRFSGPRQSPSIDTQLLLGQLGWGADIRLAKGQLDSRITLAEDYSPSGQVRLSLNDLSAPGSSIDSGLLILRGSLAEHQLSLDISGTPVSSSLEIAGGVADNHWRGALTSARLSPAGSEWNLAKPLQVDVDLVNRIANVGEHCWLSDPTRLCLEQESPLSAQDGAVALTLSRFDVAKIAAFLPAEMSWQGGFDAGVNFSWKAGKSPYLSAHVESTPGTLHWADAPPEETLSYQQLRLRLLLDQDDALADVLLRSEQLGELVLTAEVDPRDPERHLNGSFAVTGLQLRKLQPFAGPVERLAGLIEGSGEIKGTLQQPQLFGSLRLRDGQAGGPELPLDLTDMGLELTFSGQQARMTGALRTGKGQAALEGDLDWRRLPVTAALSLRGEQLEIEHDYARLKVSPDLQIRFIDGLLSVGGKVAVPWGRIEVAELPPSAVSVSNDVVIVEYEQQVAEPLPIAIDLQLLLGDDIRLQAFGLQGRITGQLKLEQEPRRPLRGVGELYIRDGNFRAYGQNLLIEDGRLVFSGPLNNPYLNVKAYRNPEVTEDDVIVGVQLLGNSDAPKLTIYSEPSMNQGQQLSYLLRGKALDSGDDGNMNATLLGIGVGQVGGVVTKFGEAIGIDDLTVDTRGAGDDTQVELKAYLLPGVQVSYGVGVFSAVNQLTVRYQLLPQVYLEAVSSLESSIDLFYQFEFD